MRPKARRFRDWFATDKGIILILALGFFCRALSYLLEAPRLMQHALELRAGWISPLIWTFGTVLLVCALRVDSRQLERVALSYAVGVCSLWTVMYIFTPAVPIPGQWWWPLDWVRVVIEYFGNFLLRGSMYATAGALAWYTVWRDSHGGIRVRGAHD